MASKKKEVEEVKEKIAVEKYRVLENFRETQDDMHLYKKGESYPREGYEPTKERIKQLITDDNKEGRPFIVEEE